MEDTHKRLTDLEEKEAAAIIFKNMEALKKDLNEYVEFFPIDDK